MTLFEKIIVGALSLVSLLFVGYIVDSQTSQGTPATAAPSIPVAAPAAPAVTPAPEMPQSVLPAPAPAHIVSDWKLIIGKNGFTDEKTCIISPLGKSHIGVIIGSFFLNYQGRGGVSAYRYRMDDQPPIEMIFANFGEKKLGMVMITGNGFDRFIRASRFRTSTVTLLSSIIEEDLDLAGLSDLYLKMRNECQR